MSNSSITDQAITDQTIQNIFDEVSEKINDIQDLESLNFFKIKYLGKKSTLKFLMSNIRHLTQEEKRIFVPRLQNLESFIQQCINNAALQIEKETLEEQLRGETIDVTLPGHCNVDKLRKGKRHILSSTIEEIKEIMYDMGFTLTNIADMEIESEWYNFTALNIPENHPARQMHDTFYINADNGEDRNKDKDGAEENGKRECPRDRDEGRDDFRKESTFSSFSSSSPSSLPSPFSPPSSPLCENVGVSMDRNIENENIENGMKETRGAYQQQQYQQEHYNKDGKEHDNKLLLRTHTSAIQIRHMLNNNPPFKIFSCGSVYRADHDATHSPFFHQLECMWIDKNITLAHLKAFIKEFLEVFFEEENLQIRFRSSYFPFTEPSIEVDIRYCNTSTSDTNSNSSHFDNWLEVLGCGMVSRDVLANVGISDKEYQGFAVGIGIERLTMLKYHIKDLRMFFQNDMRWNDYYGL